MANVPHLSTFGFGLGSPVMLICQVTGTDRANDLGIPHLQDSTSSISDQMKNVGALLAVVLCSLVQANASPLSSQVVLGNANGTEPYVQTNHDTQ